ERPAASGDLVVVDYTLAIDGHDPSSQTGYEFLVGARNVLPEIDDAVVGLRAGEERQVTLRFADDHRREDLRGRAGNATGQVLEGSAERVAIAPTETDVDAEVERLAQASQRATPALRRMMEKSGDLEGLRQGIRDRMTLELLVANAKVKA